MLFIIRTCDRTDYTVCINGSFPPPLCYQLNATSLMNHAPRSANSLEQFGKMFRIFAGYIFALFRRIAGQSLTAKFSSIVISLEQRQSSISSYNKLTSFLRSCDRYTFVYSHYQRLQAAVTLRLFRLTLLCLHSLLFPNILQSLHHHPS